MENFEDPTIFNVYLAVPNKLKILLPFVSKHNAEKKVFHFTGTTKIIKCIIGSRVASHKKIKRLLWFLWGFFICWFGVFILLQTSS